MCVIACKVDCWGFGVFPCEVSCVTEITNIKFELCWSCILPSYLSLRNINGKQVLFVSLASSLSSFGDLLSSRTNKPSLVVKFHHCFDTNVLYLRSKYNIKILTKLSNLLWLVLYHRITPHFCKQIVMQAMLNRVGYSPEISHGILVEMAEHKKELEKKTKPILDTLRSYQDLPPVSSF